jgi:hypothetical protein
VSAPIPKTDAQKIVDVTKYLHDLCFKAPEIFPSGQDVQHRVGVLLEIWQ